MEGCFMFQWGAAFQMAGGGGGGEGGGLISHNDKAILNLPYLVFYSVYSRPLNQSIDLQLNLKSSHKTSSETPNSIGSINN